MYMWPKNALRISFGLLRFPILCKDIEARGPEELLQLPCRQPTLPARLPLREPRTSIACQGRPTFLLPTTQVQGSLWPTNVGDHPALKGVVSIEGRDQHINHEV